MRLPGAGTPRQAELAGDAPAPTQVLPSRIEWSQLRGSQQQTAARGLSPGSTQPLAIVLEARLCQCCRSPSRSLLHPRVLATLGRNGDNGLSGGDSHAAFARFRV